MDSAPAPDISPELAEIWARLDLVMDPELDEPVTEMGFVEGVSITAHRPDQNAAAVEIIFRLPTYWCSPNFAFLMAQGMKSSVEALPWVGQVIVLLQDHMAADEMNAVVNAGGQFSEVFADLQPDENLTALREKFDQKAFQRRQESVIRALLAEGYSPGEVVAMTRADIERLCLRDAEQERQRIRYLQALRGRGLGALPGDPGLPDWNGDAIGPDFQTYLGLLRSVRINMEFSGSLCRGLKRSRYHEADLSGEVPFLLDLTPPPLPDGVCR